jgi:hypothetical protein
MDNIVGKFSVSYTLETVNLPEGTFFTIGCALLDKPILARKQNTVMRLFYLALADKYKQVPDAKN